MGNASSTYFIGTGNLVAVQSFQPCHLVGDADLYGWGVQASFYIQYCAIAIALLFGVERQLTNLRIALTITAGALFISLCVNSTGDNLGVLDWHLANLLVLPFPLFSVVPIVISKSIRLGLEDSVVNMRKHLTKSRDIPAAMSIYIDILETRLAIRDEKDNASKKQIEDKAFVGIFTSIDKLESPEDREEIRKNVIRIQRKQNLGGLKIEELKEEYFRGVHTSDSSEEEQPDINAISKHAEETAKTNFKLKKIMDHAQAILKRLKGDKDSESLALASVMIIWSAYLAVLPFVYFKLIGRGKVEGCTIKVIYWFVPVTLYNTWLVVILRIGSVFAVLWAFFLLMTAIGYICKGYLGKVKKVKKKGRQRARKDAKIPQEEEEDDDDEDEDDDDDDDDDDVREEGNPRSPRQIEAQQSNDGGAESKPRSRSHSPQAGDEDKSKLQKILDGTKKWFYRIYAIFFVLYLAYTMFIVIRTIQVNHIDLDKGVFSSTGQLMPFVTALFALSLVLWDCWLNMQRHRAKKAEKNRLSMLEKGEVA